MTATLAALAVSWVLPLATMAAPVRIGPEFQVSAYSTHSQAPDVAVTSYGDFVVVWHRWGIGISGRRFAAGAHPLGLDFEINAASYPSFPGPCCAAVDADTDGSFVVTWFRDDEEILARRFGSGDAPLEPPFVVNDDSIGDNLFPDVTVLQPRGDFVVVWENNVGGNRTSEIVGLRFNSLGSPLGPRFLISGEAAGGDHTPRVATMPNGGFVVVWMNFESGVAIRSLGRLYGSDGQPNASAFVVDEQASAYLGYPAVAVAENGRFVVTWVRREDVGDRGRILARRLSPDGVPLGSEFVVAVETSGLAGHPDVAMLPDGGFIIVWGQFNVQPPQVFGQEYGPNGSPRGDQFRVSTTFGAGSPRVAVDDGGRFVVVWSGPGVRAQRFTTNPVCGDVNGDSGVSATDALQTLRAAIASEFCDPCLCDGNGSGKVSATDALIILKAAVEGPAKLDCPVC